MFDCFLYSLGCRLSFSASKYARSHSELTRTRTETRESCFKVRPGSFVLANEPGRTPKLRWLKRVVNFERVVRLLFSVLFFNLFAT